MIRRPPRSTLDRSSAASDVYKRQVVHFGVVKANQEISPTMIYLSGSKIYFGDESIDISNPEEFLTSTELKLSLIHISEPTRPY